MDEQEYCVTPSILYEIAEYAAKHPEQYLHIETLSDEDGNFLSCGFFDDNNYYEDGSIWELNAKGE